MVRHEVFVLHRNTSKGYYGLIYYYDTSGSLKQAKFVGPVKELRPAMISFIHQAMLIQYGGDYDYPYFVYRFRYNDYCKIINERLKLWQKKNYREMVKGSDTVWSDMPEINTIKAIAKMKADDYDFISVKSFNRKNNPHVLSEMEQRITRLLKEQDPSYTEEDKRKHAR